jgi:hypothetical protein
MDRNESGGAGRAESETEFMALVVAMEMANAVDTDHVLAALGMVRNGIITGEGATTRGRIHFSRCIDRIDAGWVRRILLAAGAHAVTRAEADALFDIHEAALERADGGAFDDLLAKAVAHHVLAASSLPVPDRAAALSRKIPLSAWTGGAVLDADAAAWLERRLRRARRQPAVGSLAGLHGHVPVPTRVADLAA